MADEWMCLQVPPSPHIREERKGREDVHQETSASSEILNVGWRTLRECEREPCSWNLAQDACSFEIADLQHSSDGGYL